MEFDPGAPYVRFRPPISGATDAFDEQQANDTPMDDILILVGTESGNAQMVAECLADDFSAKGIRAEVMDQPDLVTVDFAARRVVLVCAATHGLGELPSNIQPLADEMEAKRPDLSHLRYGVIALGDQTYQETFCNAGKVLDGLFADLGAQRIGERLEIDACTQPVPDEEAQRWAQEWVSLL